MGLNVRFVAVPRALLVERVAEMPGWRVLGNRMLQRAKELCPVSENDGEEPHLRDQLRVVFVSGADPRILIGAPTPKLRYVTDGTEPHPIDALGDYSLHNAQTDEYFGPHVDHPGTDPNPFILTAMRQVIHDSAALA